jgi:hypothetical protein
MRDNHEEHKQSKVKSKRNEIVMLKYNKYVYLISKLIY